MARGGPVLAAVLDAACLRAGGPAPDLLPPPPHPPAAGDPARLPPRDLDPTMRFYLATLECFERQRQLSHARLGRPGLPPRGCEPGAPARFRDEAASPTGLACPVHGHPGAAVFQDRYLLRAEDSRLCQARQLLVAGALVAFGIQAGYRLTSLEADAWERLEREGLVATPLTHPPVPSGLTPARFHLRSGWDGAILCELDGPAGFWPGAPLDPEFGLGGDRPGERAFNPQAGVGAMDDEVGRAFARVPGEPGLVSPGTEPAAGTPAARDLRLCHAQQLMLAGALMAYEIGHQRALGALDEAAWDALVADGLLGGRLADPGAEPAGGSHRAYHRLAGWAGGIACEAHGAARFWPGAVLDPALVLGTEDRDRGARVNPQHAGPPWERDLHVHLRGRVAPPRGAARAPAAPGGWLGRPGP